MKPIYICFEGGDGVGKGTQISLLKEYLIKKNKSVLMTKEPGTPHIPVTEKLRSFTLDEDYKDDISDFSREYMLQMIRSIHLEKLIKPTIENKTHEYIIQDRGVFSGLSYGESNNIKTEYLEFLNNENIKNANIKDRENISTLYDLVILFYANSESDKYLNRASEKDEFKNGDVIENKGAQYQNQVRDSYIKNIKKYKKENDNNFHLINIEDIDGNQKSITEIFKEVKSIVDNYVKKN